MKAPFIWVMESKMRTAFASWVDRSISRRRSSEAPILRIPASVLRPTTPAPIRPMRTSLPRASVGILFPPLRTKRRLAFHRVEDEPEGLVQQDEGVLLLPGLVVHPEHHDPQVEDPEGREDHRVEPERLELALLLGRLEDPADEVQVLHLEALGVDAERMEPRRRQDRVGADEVQELLVGGD